MFRTSCWAASEIEVESGLALADQHLILLHQGLQLPLSEDDLAFELVDPELSVDQLGLGVRKSRHCSIAEDLFWLLVGKDLQLLRLVGSPVLRNLLLVPKHWFFRNSDWARGRNLG